MLYTFLISVVFIAEIIIAYTVISNLVKLDRKLVLVNENVESSKSGICEICNLVRKISEQCIEFAEDFVAKIRTAQEDTILKNLNKILIALVFWKVNSKAVRNFRKSKTGRMIRKTFAFLQNMLE